MLLQKFSMWHLFAFELPEELWLKSICICYMYECIGCVMFLAQEKMDSEILVFIGWM